MAVDADTTSPTAPAADRGDVVVPARTHRVRATVLLAFAVFNVVVWGTRAWQMVGERTEWSVGFVVVHLVLFGIGLATALVLGGIAWRMYGEARASGSSA